MFDFLSRLFDPADFPARWHCGAWSPLHGWLHIVSDLAIFAAYVLIPLVLAYFVRRRPDVPLPRVFWLFAAFIVSCGLTHLLEAVMFWQPVYRAAGVAKLSTAVISWATLAVLVPALPVALSLRSPMELERQVDARTRQLADARSQIERFSYWVSHDLRAPLRHLDGFVQLLRRRAEGSLDAESQRYLGVIVASAADMRGMVDGLLLFSRLGRQALQQERVDMNALVARAREELSPALEGRDVEWRVPPLPAVRGDGGLLYHVVLNLLDNALKYTAPVERPVVTLTATDAGDQVEFGVRDNGVGFDADYAHKLFEIFQRLHDASEFAGVGVGLAVAAQVVEKHGGRVRAESPGDGAAFYFTLPRDQGAR